VHTGLEDGIVNFAMAEASKASKVHGISSKVTHMDNVKKAAIDKHAAAS
jgi:hypothetical protein